MTKLFNKYEYEKNDKLEMKKRKNKDNILLDDFIQFFFLFNRRMKELRKKN